MSKKNVAGYEVEEAELQEKLAQLKANRRPRLLLEAIAAGGVAQGVRIVSPDNPEEGQVFLPTPEEARTLAEVVAKLIEARE